MVIVGSRCGGFDFYAKKDGQSEMIWLGPTETSDFDVFCADKSQIENIDLNLAHLPWLSKDAHPQNGFKLPNLWFGVEFPYKKDGKLHIPENLVYLSWAIRKRMKLKLRDIFELVNCPFEIYDKDKNFVTTIKYRPIPVRTGMGNISA
jgi:hypothetical protein